MDSAIPITISPSSAPEGEMSCYWAQNLLGEGYTPLGNIDTTIRWSITERWIQLIRSDTAEVVFSITFDDLTFLQTFSDRIEFDIQGHHYVILPAGSKKSWWNFGLSGWFVVAGAINRQYEQQAGFDKLVAAVRQAGKYRSVMTLKRLLFISCIGLFGTIAVIVAATIIVTSLNK